MKSSSFMGKVLIAVGMLFVLLSMGTFISEANAGCLMPPATTTCGGTSPTGPGGCAAGTCIGSRYPFGPPCACIDNYFSLKCYCD